jgi:hypothetical protein
VNAIISVKVLKHQSGAVHDVDAIVVRDDPSAQFRLGALRCDPPLRHPNPQASLADVQATAAALVEDVLSTPGVPRSIQHLAVELNPTHRRVTINHGFPTGLSYSAVIGNPGAAAAAAIARYVDQAG